MSKAVEGAGVRQGRKLTEGSVLRHLVLMTLPMIGGMFAMMAFNLTDTYFVSRLGTRELAAMGFTFPVVMLLGAVAMGLGMGAASVISRAIGEGDQHRIRRITTDAMLLSVPVVCVCIVAGIASIDTVFGLLGAEPDILPLIRQYMIVWYASVAVLIVPMIGSNALRATGDTLAPGLIMVFAALINVALDPIFIFGLLGFPRLELLGAALATAISRALAMVLAVLVLHYRYRLLSWSLPKLRTMLHNWGAILHVAVPSAGTHLLMPLAQAFITWLAAQFGREVVAAIGAGMRIDQFTMVVPMAMGSALVPLMGQNWGAQHYPRVRRVWGDSNKIGVAWAMACCVILLLGARPIASIFSDDPAVLQSLRQYLHIMPLGLPAIPLFAYVSLGLNATGRPMTSAWLVAVRIVVLLVPFAWVGAMLGGAAGMLWGLTAGNIASAAVALWLGRRAFTVRSAEAGENAAPTPGAPVQR